MWATTQEYKMFLKERHPKDYQQMKKAGTLEAFAEKKIEEAKDRYVQIRQELMEQHPSPKTNNPIEAIRWANEIEAQARELTNAMLYERI